MSKVRSWIEAVAVASWCALGTVPPAYADGTVTLSDTIMPLMEQRPLFAGILLDTFDFSTQASAVTIGANVNPKLAASRIGPYTLLAKRKGTPGPFTIEVVINTDQHFLDDTGHETDDVAKAVAVRESFASIEIDPLGGAR